MLMTREEYNWLNRYGILDSPISIIVAENNVRYIDKRFSKMLSDSCFQCIDDLLEAIVLYDYSDDYKARLVNIIRKLNEIRDDLDRNGEGDLLKDDKEQSSRIARKMFRNAQQKRKMSSVDFYADVHKE